MRNALDTVGNLLDLVLLFRKSSAKYTTKQIAERYNVTDDTARRYLYRLSANGVVPLQKKGVYWSVFDPFDGTAIS